MEDETLAANAAATPNDEAEEHRQAEIEKLRSERAHLQSELDDAVARLHILRASVVELQASKSSLESQILELQGQLAALGAERAEEAARAESERRALESVAARAAELEGDVSRLQHDLVMAMSEGEDAAAEAKSLKEAVEKLKGRTVELEAKLVEAKRGEDFLRHSVEQLTGDKSALEKKEREAEAKVAELRGKVESLEGEVRRVLQQKDSEIGKLNLAMTEMGEKLEVYDVKLQKVREMANGNKAGVSSRTEETVGEKHEAAGFVFPWKMVVASTGAITAVAAVACYLHHVKSR